ncbi:hypothetical protein BX667DRAFT_509673 [Coemansia mojavensis]|nr:hypothetical protein BX667DRAFT_509673 [Coemansia mojavensis]
MPSHINLLPNDIREKIFNKVVYNPQQEIREWKARLPVLAVCRLWRYEACAKVYSTIYMKIYESCFMTDDTYYETDNTEDNAVSIELYSNLSLIEHNNMARYIRQVSIAVGNTKEAYMALETIKNAVGHLRIDVNRIKVLGLYKVDDQDHFDFDYRHHQLYVEKAFDMVTRLFPNIQTIRSTSPFTKVSKIAQLRNKIIDHYMGNLKKLITTGSLTLTVPEFPQQITALELSLCETRNQQLPLIYSRQLRYLSLNNIHRNTNFNIFARASTKGKLEFPKLEYLHIYYALPQISFREVMDPDTIVLPENKTTLVFPSLQRLDLLCCYSRCPLLEKSILPEKLNWVELNCHVSLLEYFAKMRKQINWLQTTVNIVGDNIDETLLTGSNMLFGNNSIVNDASMLVYGYSGLADCTRVEWPNLTKIGFSEITATDLLDLLQFLPNLATLKVALLDTEEMPPLLENKQYKLACSSSLTTTMLIEYPRMGIASHFEQVLSFITQSCINLKRLTIAYTAEEIWQSIKQAGSPHLSSIECSLQYGSIS